MRFDTLCLTAWVSLFVTYTTADVQLVTPASGATLAGGAVTLQWKDSGLEPALVAIAAADIVLCTGTNAAPQQLTTLAGAVALGSLTSFAVTIPVTIGTSGQYFLKFVSTTGQGSVVITYSDRFTLTGMTGTVPANSGLAVTGPAGTTPAAALTETAVATAKATTAVPTTAKNGAATKVNLLPYENQIGTIRSAPPQGKPGTKITANPATVQPIFPTSAWTVFKTVGGAPVAATTITASPTYTIVTLPNQATPATFTSN